MANKLKKSFVPLRSQAEFQCLYDSGYRVHICKWLLVSFKSNDKELLRVGWTIPKFVGVAVIRNRLRRWGREYIRTNILSRDQASKDLALDVNFVFKRMNKTEYRDLNHDEFDEKMQRAFSRMQRVVNKNNAK